MRWRFFPRGWRFFPPQPAAGLTALAAAVPLGYVLYHALTARPELWRLLWETRIPELLWNTLALAGGVSILTLGIGVSTAWIMARHTFPGQRIWEWLLVLPLAFPAYVLAYIASVIASRHPWLNGWLYSFWGVATVIALATSPYVYLLARASLANLNASYEEAARSLGAGRWHRWWRVSLPILRPSLVAGVSLVILYVLADFGTVSILRYQTFTQAIYLQMTGRQDHAAAAALSVILVLLSVSFLFLERRFRGERRYYQTQGRFRTRPPRPLAGGRLLGAHLFLGGIAIPAVVAPTTLLLGWTVEAVANGALSPRFAGFAWNSLAAAAAAATLALIAAFPLAHAAARHPTPLHLLFAHVGYAGSSLPGPVVALALLLTALSLAPPLYGTVILLVAAYVVRFLPMAIQAEESSLQQITPSLEHAAKSLGSGPFAVQRRVTLPLIRGGLGAAWTIVFLNAIKELPATLLLRPVGFDTLAIRIWLETSDNMYHLAAPAALLLVMVAIPALAILRPGGTVSREPHLSDSVQLHA